MDRVELLTIRLLRVAVIGGAVLGSVSTAVLAGVVAARVVGTSGGRLDHLVTLALVGTLVLVVMASTSSGLWMLLARVHSGIGVDQRRLLSVVPWFPSVAAVAPLVSLTVSGDTAHQLLNLPHAGSSFTIYLAGLCLALHIGVVAGVWLTSDRRVMLPEEGLSSTPWQMSSLVRGILLAVTLTVAGNQAIFKYLSARQGEFATHRYAAIRLLRGDDPFDSMREVWQQINVPPVTIALVYTPWALLPIEVAQVGWGILHIGAIITATALIARAYMQPRIPNDLLAVGIILLFSVYEPWRDTIWLGQPNGFILLCLTGALLMARRDRWFYAGALVALSLLFKPVASWVVLYIILTRRWSAMAGGALAGLGLVAVSLPIAGFNWWWVWITRKVGDLALGNALHSNISLQAVHARLSLVSHAYYDANALPRLPLAAVLNGLMLVTALALLLGLSRRARPLDDGIGLALEWGLAIAISLTTSPLTWVHYSTVSVVPFVILLDSTRSVDWLRAPRGVRRAIATFALLAFALLSMDEEIFLVRTAFWWETWPMLGSIPAASLPLLVVALSLRLWLRNHDAFGPSVDQNAAISA